MPQKTSYTSFFFWLTLKKWPNDLGNWGNKTLLVRGCWFTPFITVFWAHLVGDKPECRVDDISGNHVCSCDFIPGTIWLSFHTETGKLQLARISPCVPHPTQPAARTTCDRPWTMQRSSLEKLKKNVIWNEIHDMFNVQCSNGEGANSPTRGQMHQREVTHARHHQTSMGQHVVTEHETKTYP